MNEVTRKDSYIFFFFKMVVVHWLSILIYLLVSAGMVTVVKNVHPPPPPPRKALPAIPTVDPPLEKPTQSPARDLQIPTTQFEPLETQG